MEKVILDTDAAIPFIYNEKGAEKVEKAVTAVISRRGKVYMSAVNYGEFFYAVFKKSGSEIAVKARNLIDMIPIEVVDADKNMALIAGTYKAEKKMSFADCFTAALAKITGAPVLTGDPECKEGEKDIKMMWVEKVGAGGNLFYKNGGDYD